jgi:hypothetical protein
VPVRWLTRFLNRQTPVVRVSTYALIGAFVSFLLRLLGGHLESTVLIVTSTLLFLGFLFLSFWAFLYLPNR